MAPTRTDPIKMVLAGNMICFVLGNIELSWGIKFSEKGLGSLKQTMRDGKVLFVKL